MEAPNPQLALLLRIDQQLALVLGGSGSGAQAAPQIVGAFCETLGWACGSFWSRDAEVADRLVCLGAWGIATPGVAEYLNYTHGRHPILSTTPASWAPPGWGPRRCG
jgi:hypothetical protein